MTLVINWFLIIIVAFVIDITIGEFPVKHPVQFMGDYIKWFERIAYKNSINRGRLLLISLVFIVLFITVGIEFLLFYLTYLYKLPEFIPSIILGLLASTGLASKSLKLCVSDVIKAEGEEQRDALQMLVTRDTRKLTEKRVYSSLIETYSENMSDGVIAPLIYLILFGFPGIMVYKAISTLDSMVGYKNDKYINFGKSSAIIDDLLNYIPARLTMLFIWVFSKSRPALKTVIAEAKKYSSSPNAGYPVVAAAYNLGVVLGGAVYYGEDLVEKAEVGQEITEDYKLAVQSFVKLHSLFEIFVLLLIIVLIAFSIICVKFLV